MHEVFRREHLVTGYSELPAIDLWIAQRRLPGITITRHSVGPGVGRYTVVPATHLQPWSGVVDPLLVVEFAVKQQAEGDGSGDRRLPVPLEQVASLDLGADHQNGLPL